MQRPFSSLPHLTYLCVGNGEVLLIVSDDRVRRLNVRVALIVQLFVKHVQTSTGIRCDKAASRRGQPFDTRHFRLVQIALGDEGRKSSRSSDRSTYSFVEDFLFFALHVDVLNLPFGKADENMQDIGVRLLVDIMTGWLMILFVDTMVNRFAEIRLNEGNGKSFNAVCPSKLPCSLTWVASVNSWMINSLPTLNARISVRRRFPFAGLLSTPFDSDDRVCSRGCSCAFEWLLPADDRLELAELFGSEADCKRVKRVIFTGSFRHVFEPSLPRLSINAEIL